MRTDMHKLDRRTKCKEFTVMKKHWLHYWLG